MVPELTAIPISSSHNSASNTNTSMIRTQPFAAVSNNVVVQEPVAQSLNQTEIVHQQLPEIISNMTGSSTFNIPNGEDGDRYVLVTVVPEDGGETVIHIYRVHGEAQIPGEQGQMQGIEATGPGADTQQATQIGLLGDGSQVGDGQISLVGGGVPSSTVQIAGSTVQLDLTASLPVVQPAAATGHEWQVLGDIGDAPAAPQTATYVQFVQPSNETSNALDNQMETSTVSEEYSELTALKPLTAVLVPQSSTDTTSNISGVPKTEPFENVDSLKTENEFAQTPVATLNDEFGVDDSISEDVIQNM